MLFQAFVAQSYIFIDQSLHCNFFIVNFLKLQLLTEYMWPGFFLNLNLRMFMCSETVSLKYLEIYLHLYYLFKGISIQTVVTTATMKVIKLQMESTSKFKDDFELGAIFPYNVKFVYQMLWNQVSLVRIDI